MENMIIKEKTASPSKVAPFGWSCFGSTFFLSVYLREKTVLFSFSVGPCSVYSMVDGSRQGFFPFVGGKKIKIYWLAVVGKFGLFSGDFGNILMEILPIW